MTSLGVRFDFGGAMQLAPGDSFDAPEAAIAASAGDMDDLANQFHRYQREFVVPKSKINSPPLVQFNSWYPFPGKMTVADMKKAADAAAEMGAEVFVLDAGWYNKKDWSRELGDYKADRVAFPKGIEELSEHVRAKGMKFGIWVEIENAGPESEIFKTNPDWFFQKDGKPLTEGVRSMMDFSNAHASYRAREVLEKLVKDYELSWVKIDYNIDIGERFDPAGMKRPGDRLINHLRAYYNWLDWARGEFPNLIIENCSSGGLRFDLGLIGHTHTTWLSDEILPKPSLALGWGCALEFLPEACNHWMVGDTHQGDVKNTSDLGWMEFMLRVPMNGQYGLSSKIFDWTPAMRKLAADNIAIYKRIRTVIAGGDTYHLTPQPNIDDPRGWMAMQYSQPDQRRSVVLAYRLPGGETSRQFKLRGLDPALTYAVKLDGKPLTEAKGSDLASSGLRVALNAEWRAAVVELEAR
jgi:alpha-galactosidase